MRIVQIIDSLDTGGAERMAVNYANALSKQAEFSGLIVTRKEGLLLNQIDKRTSYLFLNKRKSFDIKALLVLRKFLKKNKVDIIQAHSSSFFISILVKLTLPKIKIIWHDHYGITQNLAIRKNVILKFSSFLFLGIVSVNTSLKTWAKSYLHCKNVIYLPNFIYQSDLKHDHFTLKGRDGKRIICVANLRPQKNHNLLIEGASVLHEKFPDWTFHCIGKDFKDNHSKKLKERVSDLNLQETVFFYDAVNNVSSILEQGEIAVLTSLSEGLPLAILEYGLYKLPVIATEVGEIRKVIPSEKEGLVIESDNLDQLVHSLEILIEKDSERIELAENLYKYINENFSESSILKEYLLWLQTLIKFTR